MINNKLHLIGYLSGIAGVRPETGQGALTIKQSSFLKKIAARLQWEAMIQPIVSDTVEKAIALASEQLAKTVSHAIKQEKWVTVIGGDHTSAIGTFSGLYDALHEKGDIGLIWLDAHMDSHTPETTESGRLHGMPLASLLGYGYPSLTNILHSTPKLKPDHVCLIGVRNYEAGEAALLKKLKVRVYLMEEVKWRGFEVVFREAIAHIRSQTVGYGISLDIDSIDPREAPGVDVREPDGLSAKILYEALSTIFDDEKLRVFEIAEFNPSRDENQCTEEFITSLITAMSEKNHANDRD